MGKLTTHVLDTAHGCPAKEVAIRLFDGNGKLLVETKTNDDGRCDAPILEGSDFQEGTYRLEFAAGDYFRARGLKLPQPAFVDVVILQFGISDQGSHYHVPLLVSPFSYSTYRGS